MGIELAKLWIRLRADGSGMRKDMQVQQRLLIRQAQQNNKQQERLLRRTAQAQERLATARVREANRTVSIQQKSSNQVLRIHQTNANKQLQIERHTNRMRERLLERSYQNQIREVRSFSKMRERLIRKSDRSSAASSKKSPFSGMMGAGALLGSAGGLGGIIGGASLGLLAKTGLEAAAEMEQAEISFGVFLGNAEKAKKVIIDLRDFAAKTPFRFPELERTAKTLLAFGISTEDLMPTVSMLGDLVAASGADFQRLTKAYTDVRAKQKLTAQETNQFSENNIALLPMLEEHFGKNTKAILEMREAGKITFKDVEAVLKKATSEGGRYYRLTEKLSMSLGGIFSTLKDEAYMAMGQAASVIAPVLKKMMLLGIDTIKGIKTYWSSWGPFVSNLMDRIAFEIDYLRKVFADGIALIYYIWAAELGQIYDVGKGIFSSISDNVKNQFGIMQTYVGEFTIRFRSFLSEWIGYFKIAIAEMKTIWSDWWGGKEITEAVGDAMRRAAGKMILSAGMSDGDASALKMLTDERSRLQNKPSGISIDISKQTQDLIATRDQLMKGMVETRLQMEWERAQMKKATEDLGVEKPPTDTDFGGMGGKDLGFVGFEEFGRKITESLVQKDDDVQQKMLGALEKGNEIQKQQLAAMKTPPLAAGMLT